MIPFKIVILLLVFGNLKVSQASEDCSTIAGCDTCSNPDVMCDMCKAGTISNTDGSKCLECPGHCSDCKLNSDESKAICGKCHTGYYASADKTKCMSCPAMCDTCSDPGDGKPTCSKCKGGYHLDPSSVQCKDCSMNCVKCNGVSNCMECKPGYQLDNSMMCEKCEMNCLTCENDVCTDCASGYFWNGTRVEECLDNCNDCDNKDTCKKCDSGFFLNQAKDMCADVDNCAMYEDEVGCTGCNPGFHLVDASTCKACPMFDQSNCDTCMDGNTGSVWEGNVCKACPENCLSCLDSTSCFECADGLVWENSMCKACVIAQLEDAVSCWACENKYWNGSTCFDCPNDMSEPASSAVCTQCNSLPGAFWTVGKCLDVNCSSDSLTQTECMYCKETKRWDSNSGACVDLDCNSKGLSMDECGECDGRIWEEASCLFPACSDYDMKDEFSCNHCPIKQWDETTQSCIGLTCRPTSSEEDCRKCKSYIWNNTTGRCDFLTVDCQGALTTEEECNACNVFSKYWEDDQCKTNTGFCSDTTSEAVCASCNFRFWNGTMCEAVTCTGTLDTRGKCAKCNYQLWDPSDSTCKIIDCEGSNTPDNERECNGCPIMSFDASTGDCSFDSACFGGTPTNRDDCFTCRHFGQKWDNNTDTCGSHDCATSNETTRDECDWCSPFKGYKEASCAFIDCTKPGGLSQEQCAKCPKLIYNGVCQAVNCNLTTLTEMECGACSDSKYWDGTSCVASFDCDTTPIRSEEMCHSCATKMVGKMWNPTEGCCTVCPAGCASCDADNKCLSCEEGKFWHSDTETCADCTAHNLTTMADCNTCPGRVWEDGTCESCPMKCTSCSSSIVCDQCETGLMWNPTVNMCYDCLLDTETECMECEGLNMGHYFDDTNDVCHVCPLTCTSCDSSAECTGCAAGFYLLTTTSGGGVSTTMCTSCSKLTEMTTKEQCVSCGSSSDKYWDAGSSTCEDCDTQCLICDVMKGCTTCKPGYYVKDGVCSACIKDCKMCSDDTKCHMCDSGFCLDEDKDACHQAPSSFSDCHLCSKVDNDSGTGSTVQCVECSSGHFMEYCQACTDSHCSDCEDDVDTCAGCMAGYYLDNGECKDCPGFPLCMNCASGSKCDKCEAGYYYYSVGDICDACPGSPHCESCESGLKCDKCNTGYFYHSDANTCKACIEGCSECSDTTTCLTCRSMKTYDSEGKTCEDCPAACEECEFDGSGDIQCSMCISTHYLKEGVCETCSSAVDHCTKCDDAGKCEMCGTGYVLNEAGTTCEACDIDDCGKCVDPPLRCDSCADNKVVYNEGMECLDACYFCDGGVDCKNKTDAVSAEICPGLGDTHSCWTVVTRTGEGDENVNVKRMCSNMTCTDEYTEEVCVETNEMKECKMCCTTNLCNSITLAEIQAGGGAVSMTINILLVTMVTVLTTLVPISFHSL